MGFHHNRITTERNRRKTTCTRIKWGLLVSAVAFCVTTTGWSLTAPAEAASTYISDPGKYSELEKQIKALENQINDYNDRASELAKQADTLNAKIAELQNQQASIQAQINLSEAKKQELEQKIADNEAKIKKQSEALSVTLQDMYYSGQTTSLDILMNSNSVSDYVDKQTRQQAMSDQITDSVKQVKELKAQLEQQKSDVQKTIDQQASQKQDLANSQAEQQQLLDQTHGQESEYQALTKKTQDSKASLEEQQRQLIVKRISGGSSSGSFAAGTGPACGGGYPGYLCNAGKDTLVDPWGMYNRECVSYAAFKVNQTYGWPSYWTRGGNDAKYWANKAKRYGIPVDGTPRAGDVAVMTSGAYGHVAWVESVSGSTITISQYNADMKGTYSRVTTSASAFDYYIHFSQMP